MEQAVGFLRSAGPCLSPFNAWVFLKGLETLRIRMEAHSRSALEIAQWLQAQPGVTGVNYAGLASHPDHALACRQQRGFGGVLSFTVAGGQAAAWRFIDATRLISITANLGDAKTTIVHPATTTHGRLSRRGAPRAGHHAGADPRGGGAGRRRGHQGRPRARACGDPRRVKPAYP